jgi:hypothetical protein
MSMYKIASFLYDEFETRKPYNEYFTKSSNPPRKPSQDKSDTWEAAKCIQEYAARRSEMVT